MAVSETEKKKQPSNKENETEPLIPGLPDEVAELCLLHLPYPYQALVRSVSSSWNRAITEPWFLNSKKTLSRPYFFVFAFHKHTSKFQWQALDPSYNSWFVLPTMPFAGAAIEPPETIACASLPKQGKLLVVLGSGAMQKTKTLVYRTTTNQWSPAAALPAPAEPFCAAEGANGKIVTVEGSMGLGVEIYDPEKDTWRAGARLGIDEMVSYEAVENGGRVYVTEGWRWPFTARPRGWVYEAEGDTWQEMGEGMRDGWTGVAVAAAGKMFSIAEYGDSDVKVYDEGRDTWRRVGGDRFPREKVQRPFKARGSEGRIYVASRGLNVAIGSVIFCQDEKENVKLKWQVVEAPHAFREFQPCNCQLLYA